jgi:hypothetical protein
MLYMVIERFKPDALALVSERFRLQGRMLPEGLVYQTSWVDSPGTCCFQVMETEDPELLDIWVSRWDDLVNFEIIPVLTSSDFWAKNPPELT